MNRILSALHEKLHALDRSTDMEGVVSSIREQLMLQRPDYATVYPRFAKLADAGRLREAVEMLKGLQPSVTVEPLERYLEKAEEIVREVERISTQVRGGPKWVEHITRVLRKGEAASAADLVERWHHDSQIPWASLFFRFGFPMLMLLPGLGMMLGGTLLTEEARASAGWISVRGTVTSSRVRRSTTRSSRSGANNRPGVGAIEVSYEAEIVYEYEVSGQRYRGNKFSFGLGTADRASAAARVAHYPIGTTVDVFFDPARPARAVLVPGEQTTTSSLFWIGACLTGFTFLFVVLLPLTPWWRRSSG